MWSIMEREGFLQRVDYSLRAGGQAVGLIVLRIANLRRLRNSLGAGPSEQLFETVLERLAALPVTHVSGQRPTTLVIGRLSQDEAGIAIQGVITADDVADIAHRVQTLMSTPVEIGAHLVGLDARIGSAGPLDVLAAEELLRRAQIAVEHKTHRGMGGISAFTPDMLAWAGQRVAMETDLRQALTRESELYLLYQPQVSFKTGLIESVEALVRWDHPGMGLTLPGKFISFAEERGMGLAICDWVMTHACRQMQAWQEAGLGHLGMSINLSSDSLEIEGIAERLADILSETGACPDRLELEITERFVMDDPETCFAAFGRLKSLGVTLALDDFGTGYSSLTQLQYLPVNRLKIDRSFVAGLPENEQNLALVKGIVGLAHGMGLTVVAEGVETEEEWKMLAHLGCDSYQGFYFAEPMSVEAVAQRIEEASGELSPLVTGNA